MPILPDVYLIVVGDDSGGGGGGDEPVVPTLVSIAVTPSDPSLAISETQQMTATGTYSDSSTADLTGSVTWESSDDTKATVDSGGLVAAVASGSADVTATLGDISGFTTVTVEAQLFMFDLTQLALPSGLTAARTGDTIYAARSVSTAVAVAGADVYEDRGDGRGGGHWVFDAYTNEMASPFSFAAGGNNFHINTLTYTANVGTGPDGTANADRIRDADAAAIAYFYFVGSAPGSTYAGETPTQGSVWVKDVIGDAPTAEGAASAFEGYVGTNLSTGTTWRRIHSHFSKSSAANQADYFKIFPAGKHYDAAYAWVDAVAAVGAIDVWGGQVTYALGDVPLCDTATSALTITADNPENALLDNGDLYLEGAFLWDDLNRNSPQPVSWNGELYLFSMETAGGLTSLRIYNQSTLMRAEINGADKGADAYAYKPTFYYNHELRWEFWNRPSDNKAGYNIWWNGCRQGGEIETARIRFASATQTTPTSFYLNNNLGAAESSLPATVTLLRRIDEAPAGGRRDVGVDENACEGVILGDSVVAPVSPDGFMTGAYIYTYDEGRERRGIVSMAHSGDTVLDQTSAWLASPQRGAADIQWVIIQLGLNDIYGGSTAAQIAAALSTLIDDINAENPGAAVFLSPMTPARGSFAGGQYAVWQAANDNIAGTGANPVTGDFVLLDPWTDLNDGADYLKTEYLNALADGVHPNDYGRFVQAAAFRAALSAENLL